MMLFQNESGGGCPGEDIYPDCDDEGWELVY